MVERKAEWTAQAMDGAIVSGDPATSWSHGFLDSRRVEGGEIFFALPGEQADGHDYVAAAAANGAAVVVVHRDVEVPTEPVSSPLDPPRGTVVIRVDDTYKALHDLTRALRAQVPEKLVAITGSAGKTTTKELLAAMLGRSFKVTKSLGNFNNLYGFPVALFNIDDGCEWMVAEMGMSTPGELGGVSRLGRPDVALFTNVRPAHLENFGSVEAIADAKAELLDGLVEGGLIVANADDPQVERIVERYVRERDPKARVVRYGIVNEAADVRATAPAPRGDDLVGSRFELSVDSKTVVVELPIHGLYNAENCLAAAACAHTLGVSLDEVSAAVADFLPPAGRGEVYHLGRDIVLVDDSYNSNPDAAVKALESAREIPGERHVAVLGDMLELGKGEREYHVEVGESAARLGFDTVVGVGARARDLVGAAGRLGAVGAHFSLAVQAAVGTPSVLHPGDVVLVKGSRGVGLEVVVRAIRETFISAEGAT